MTTCAFDGKTLAADSLSIISGLRWSHKKLHCISPFWLAGSGETHQIRHVIDWVTAHTQAAWLDPDQFPAWSMYHHDHCTPTALLVDSKTRRLWRLNCDRWQVVTQPFYAIGSGADFAMGAMAAGKCAKEAVAIAAKLDAWSGGEIDAVEFA